MGIPGTISPATGLVKNANSTCLIGHHLDRDLAEILDRPVKIANDANCFVLSEAHDGSAKAATTAFGVILGTGVGGGLVVKAISLRTQQCRRVGSQSSAFNQGGSRSGPRPHLLLRTQWMYGDISPGAGLQRSYQECAQADLTYLPSARKSLVRER